MEIESEIEVSIAENINNSNVDGAIDNKEVCKVEEDEVEELKFESNCNSEDRNEGNMDSDEDNVAIPEGEEHPNVDPSGVEGSKDIIKLEEIDSSERKYRGMGHTVWQPEGKMLMLLHSRNRRKILTSMTIDIMAGVLDGPLALLSR